MPSFPMPAADELDPDRDQQHAEANGPDLSELDIDASDLIEGNGQPIAKDTAPPPTPESTAEGNGGPDLSLLDVPDDETPPKTQRQEDDIRTAKDFDELLGNRESGVGEGDGDSQQNDDQTDSESPPEVSQTDGYVNVIRGTASTPPPTPETAGGITFDHDLLCRIYNAELACRRAESEVESCKEQLKEAKAELEGKVERLRELASEAAAADHDAKRPLFNPSKLAETSSETADSPTPTPESEAESSDDEDELDHTPETSEVVQQPLVIRLTVSQDILDQDDSPFELVHGKEYDVHILDDDGDIVILDEKGQETTLTADEFEVVTWSGPIEVDDSGKPIVTRRENWPEGKAPAKVVCRPNIIKIADGNLTAGKTYAVESIESMDASESDEFTIRDDRDEQYLIGDDQYQVVEWMGLTAEIIAADIDGDETDDGEGWESLDVNNLDLPDAIINKLYDERNGINTIGELCAVKSDGADFSVISGIGEKKAEQIEDALEKFWAKRNGDKNT